MLDTRDIPQHKNYYASIQVLRAVAALGVLLFHEFPGQFTIGAAGVDIFFVISGFIIGTIGSVERPAVFFIRRLIRIAPLYWAVTLLMCVGTTFTNIFSHFTFDSVQLTKSLLFIPYYNDEGKIWPLAVSGWTLNYEMFFYIVFGAALLTRRPVTVTGIVLSTLVVAGMLFSPQSAPLHVWTDPLLVEFLAGLVLSQLAMICGITLGLVLLILGVVGFITSGLADITEPRLTIWGLPALMLVTGALAIERAGRWPSLKPIELIGTASYSLYLLHGVVIAFVHKVLGHRLIAELPTILIGSTGLAWLSLRYVEVPVNRFLRQMVQTNSWGNLKNKFHK